MVLRRHRRQRSSQNLLQVLESRILFSFGITDSGGSLLVDTGAQLTFTLSKSNGDVLSMKYRGNELQAPHSLTQRYSHYASGLSSSSAVAYTVDNADGWAMVSVTDSGLGVTQYYMARNGYNNLYMATYAGGASPPSPGEMRFLTYLNYSIFTNHPDASDTKGGTAIEGSDVFAKSDGTTHSKFYDSAPFIDDTSHGVTGSTNGQNVGAFMMIGSHETSSGGPFFKDIEFQSTGNAVEMYNYMYSGHTQTENFRPGLQGPYAIAFTDGGAPAPIDYSFMDAMNLQGWVPASGRGSLTGVASGITNGDRITVGLANATAEYWGTPAANGSYTITGIKPGTYTETLYDQELAVGTASVTISAGGITTRNIANSIVRPSTIWTIGAWDGTPAGFLNADQIAIMHPSDPRLNPWPATTTYVIGSSTPASWPLIQAKDINNDSKVVFTLSTAQSKVSLTLRVGISFAYAGGRPYIVVNKGAAGAWTSSIPAASSQPDSRGITRGTWRGNNVTFTYTIPASALIAGQNSIDLIVASGSSTSGWLSPSVTYDAIDLLGPNNAPTVAVPAMASVTPVTGNSTILSVLGADDDGESELTYTWAIAGPAGVALSANGTNGAKSTTATFAAPGTYTFTCTITDAGGLSVSSATTILVSDLPPELQSVTLNDGAAQRSMVNSVTLQFSRQVTLAPGALTLALHPSVNGGGAVGTLPGAIAWSSADGGFTYTVTFSGGNVTAGSLADGVYDLQVHAALVTDVWGHFLPGGDSTTTFYRLFGDVNGDGIVDSLDSLFFRSRQGSATGSSGYRWYLDYDNSGIIDSLDSLQFRKRLGASYTIS